MTDWVISHSDVEKHEKYGKVTLDEILFDFGMDIKQGYESDGRSAIEGTDEAEGNEYGYTHRSPFSGEIHTCPRYFGVARTDGKWRLFTEKFVAVSR